MQTPTVANLKPATSLLVLSLASSTRRRGSEPERPSQQRHKAEEDGSHPQRLRGQQQHHVGPLLGFGLILAAGALSMPCFAATAVPNRARAFQRARGIG
jgi:hypothetical protein